MVVQDIINCYTFVPKNQIVLQTEEKNGTVIRVETINTDNQKRIIVYNK